MTTQKLTPEIVADGERNGVMKGFSKSLSYPLSTEVVNGRARGFVRPVPRLIILKY